MDITEGGDVSVWQSRSAFETSEAQLHDQITSSEHPFSFAHDLS